MQFSYFQAVFPHLDHWELDHNYRYVLCTRPLRCEDLETGAVTKFKSLKEAWAFRFDGVQTVEEALASIERFWTRLSGRKGSSSDGLKEFKFGHASGSGGDMETTPHFPAEANTRIKVKTEQNAIDYFAKQYRDANHEYGMLIDPQGFVHDYKEGGATSVGISGRKGTFTVHNHPSGGAFSDSDLIATAHERSSGIAAIGKGGDYYFRKNGGHFKGPQFARAVKKPGCEGRTTTMPSGAGSSPTRRNTATLSSSSSKSNPLKAAPPRRSSSNIPRKLQMSRTIPFFLQDFSLSRRLTGRDYVRIG